MRKLKQDRRNGRTRIRTAIEFGASAVKLARVGCGRGGPQLLGLAVRGTGGLTDTGIAGVLREEIAAAGGDAGQVTLVIAPSRAITRTLRLPSHDQRELDGMVQLQVPLLVPLKPEQVASGFRIVSRDEDGFATVHLAMVDREVVAQQLAVLREAGLEPHSVQLGSEAYAVLVDALPADPQAAPGTVAAVVDFDRDTTHVGLTVDGRLAFTRSISLRAADLAVDGPDGHGTRVLCSELQRTFSLFASEVRQKPVDRIVVTGSAAIRRVLAAAIGKHLALPVAETAADAFLADAAAAGDAPAADPEDTSVVAVIGLAAWPVAAGIELLPEGLLRRRRTRSVRSQVFKTAIRVAVVLALVSVVAQRELERRERQVQLLDDEIRALMPVTMPVEEIERKLGLIDRRLEDKGLVLDLLTEIQGVAPADMSLSRFSYDRDRGLVLKGTAANMASVVTVTQQLERSPLFSNVLVGFASQRSDGGREVTDFQLNIELEAKGGRRGTR